MLQRLLTCALFAGLTTGLLMFALHGVLTVPLIAQAEVYEYSSAPAAAAAHEHHHHEAVAASTQAGHDHDHAGGWEPQGWSRVALTLLATVASTIGFALMLVAAAIFTYGELDVWHGLGFGLAGFAATGLAISFGLAPELPGAAASDLVMRQAWWIGTAAATAVGIAAMMFGARPAVKLLGLILLAAPHIIGAPEIATTSSPVPAELSALFAARTLALQAVMWIVLGAACGWVWQFQSRRAGAAAPA